MLTKTKTKPVSGLPTKTKEAKIDLRAVVKASAFKNFETLAAAIGCSPVTLYAAAKDRRYPRSRTITRAVQRALRLRVTHF